MSGYIAGTDEDDMLNCVQIKNLAAKLNIQIFTVIDWVMKLLADILKYKVSQVQE
jgi:hypothetical protein